MSRTAARHVAMKLLYESMAGGGGRWETVTGLMEVSEDDLDADDKAYVDYVLDGVNRSACVLDELIQRFAKDWSVERMPYVDLSIMRLSAYELTQMAGIPPSVSINEALELAHTYSTPDAVSFINGVLGNIARSLPTSP